MKVLKCNELQKFNLIHNMIWINKIKGKLIIKSFKHKKVHRECRKYNEAKIKKNYTIPGIIIIFF